MKKLVDGVEVEMTPEEVAEWEAQQNTPLPVFVPQVVSARQAKRALLGTTLPSGNNLLDVVNGLIATMPREDQIDWECATEVARDWPLLPDVQAMLGMTSEQIDSLFILAATK